MFFHFLAGGKSYSHDLHSSHHPSRRLWAKFASTTLWRGWSKPGLGKVWWDSENAAAKNMVVKLQVGGFSPTNFEKYVQVKLNHFPLGSRWTFKKYLKPPPRLCVRVLRPVTRKATNWLIVTNTSTGGNALRFHWQQSKHSALLQFFSHGQTVAPSAAFALGISPVRYTT